MKLTQYAIALNKMAKKYPNAIAVCSSDDEGNSFQRVVYKPTAGHFEGNEFDGANNKDVNAVCIN